MIDAMLQPTPIRAIADALPVRHAPRKPGAHAMIERLLRAARAVLQRDGYAGFVTQAISAQAQVSIGSVYRYFPDREAVLAGLALQNAAALAEAFDDAFEHGPTQRTDIVDRLVDVLQSRFARDVSMPLVGIGSRLIALEEPPSWADIASPAVDALWMSGIPAARAAEAVATLCELVDAMLAAVHDRDDDDGAALSVIHAAAQAILRACGTAERQP